MMHSVPSAREVISHGEHGGTGNSGVLWVCIRYLDSSHGEAATIVGRGEHGWNVVTSSHGNPPSDPSTLEEVVTHVVGHQDLDAGLFGKEMNHVSEE